jgi:hypothetical protein
MKMCDFCTELPGEWIYPSHDGPDWYACGACSKFIEEEDLKSLVERAQSILSPGNIQLKNQLYHLYIEWWRHSKSGGRIGYDPRKQS